MASVILITGASTGLGEQIATYLAKRGHIVYGTSRSISKLSKPFRTLDMDICSVDSVQQAVKQILNEQGRLDVLVNNAGLGIAAPLNHYR